MKLILYFFLITILMACKEVPNKSGNEMIVKNDALVGKTTSKQQFGMYLHSRNEAYKKLDYTTLEGAAYMCYEIDPNTGNPMNSHDWKTTTFIDSLKHHQLPILLGLSNSGRANNKKLLKNPKAVNVLIDNAIRLINLRLANGICVNFQNVIKSNKHDFSSFIALLNQELSKNTRNASLYLVLPAIDEDHMLDFEVLIPMVDYFIIMDDVYDLEATKDYYLNKKVPMSKLKISKWL